nr:MAG TPA: hypothetical protein [Caudoviricetes sp.]
MVIRLCIIQRLIPLKLHPQTLMLDAHSLLNRMDR